jgi:hypothetical protein
MGRLRTAMFWKVSVSANRLGSQWPQLCSERVQRVAVPGAVLT